jgi:AcrR family transcriptional regulator
MSDEPGLRERKKERTRRALGDIAVSRFAERGVDATTVEEICREAEVSPATFFRYFPAKEAAAFAGEDERVAVLEAGLRAGPAGEPVAVAVRRAALALVDHDLAAGDPRAHAELLRREPALAAYAARVQAAAVERLTVACAELLGVDPRGDLRPRLVVSAAVAAVGAAWAAWLDGGAGDDLRDLVGRALDMLDAGLADL